MNLYPLNLFLTRLIGSLKAIFAEQSYISPLQGINEILEAAPPFSEQNSLDAERPIFLFATGWRTGSTLFQRILVSGPQVIIWEEPLGYLGIISRLSDMVASFERRIAPDDVILRCKSTDASESWIANLYP